MTTIFGDIPQQIPETVDYQDGSPGFKEDYARSDHKHSVVLNGLSLTGTTVGTSARSWKAVVAEGYAELSSATQAITNAYVDVAGATITHTKLLAGDVVYINWQGFIDSTTATSNRSYLEVRVNGSVVTANQAGFSHIASTGTSASVASSTKYTIPTNGDYIFKLVVKADTTGIDRLIGNSSGSGDGTQLITLVLGIP